MFNGTNYIDTGINMFSAENINKDFIISLTIDSLGINTSQATLLNVKDESKTNYWPGFAYRTNSSGYLELTARWPKQTNYSSIITKDLPILVTFSRENGVLYYKLNDGQKKKFINVPTSSFNETFNEPFNSNVTIGASINSEGNPFRFFNGIVSNISVELID